MPCAFRLCHSLRRSSGCQFVVPEDELIEFDGKAWCRFHLPLRADNIESEKVQWDAVCTDLFIDAIFARIDAARRNAEQVSAAPAGYFPFEEGEKWRERTADLSGVVFPKDVTFERYAGEAGGLPDVLFPQATFSDYVVFNGVTFRGLAIFDGARFGGTAMFEGVTFVDTAMFGWVKFDGIARFGGKALFKNDARLYWATFGDLALFDEATFEGNATFYGARFDSDTSFDGAVFHGDALFDGDVIDQGESGANVFRRAATFRCVRFNKRAAFINRHFLNSTDFRGATFRVTPEFHNAVLHQDTRFSGTRFLAIMHLTYHHQNV